MDHKIEYRKEAAKNLRRLRIEKGISIKDAIAATGLTSLSQYESGEVCPQNAAINKLIRFYDMESLMESTYTRDDPKVKWLSARWVGVNIRTKIKARRIVRGKIAEFTGISLNHIVHVEYGYGLNEDVVSKIAEYMKISVKELIGAPSLEELREVIAGDYSRYLDQYQADSEQYDSKYRRKKPGWA